MKTQHRLLKSSETLVESGILILHPGFKQEEIAKDTPTPTFSEHVVILCELEQAIFESIETELKGIRCLNLQSECKEIDIRFELYATWVFEEIQRILIERSKGVLIQIVFSSREEQMLFSGLSGLLKTARLENPKVTGQLIEVEPGESSKRILEKIMENSRSSDTHIRYQDGKRFVAVWDEVDTSSEEVDIPWKDNGIYLITGGAGSLGHIFSKEIAQKVGNAVIILTGRSLPDRNQQVKLKELTDLGVKVEYKQVDVTQEKEVVDLIQSIQEEFGGLDGIIHGAGMIRDNFILRKTREELQAVLRPKVTGLVNLDNATINLNLEFFILFSSIAGAVGNIGQADYSTANAFMDAYSKYRNNLVASGQRRGRTMSVNWPLWKEGGMHVDQVTEELMKRNMGIIPMRTPTGIGALYQGFVSGKEQVMLLEGDVSVMWSYFLNTSSKVSSCSTREYTWNFDSELLREKIINKLKNMFGEITKLEISSIDADEPLESYGIDSIMITRLNIKLAGIFGELSKTLFFEYLTLGALAEYFVSDYPQECVKWTGLDKPVRTRAEKSPTNKDIAGEFPVLNSIKAKKKRIGCRNVSAHGNKKREPIAIIGISGRYPQANNLKEYWENLKAGKDCITEIPKDRWPLAEFFNPDPKEAVAQGKSYSKWGGFVEGFAYFDPLFFNISPREAFNMDPQERVFIESCWEALEDAGYTREQLASKYRRSVGVFVGITKTGFGLYGPDLWKQGEVLFPHTSFASLANRVSFLLNLQGPSMPLDTMCSASLTAIHEACEHIHNGECELAIAGGVNLYLHPSCYVELCAHQMLSKDGQCKSFGLGGNGFVPGEGVGTVLLKSLSQAIADKDHIYAVIRGTSVNHGGKTNGYTVPNPKAQAEVIRAAMDKAGVNARAVTYIEAHGTGTELGDPIEITGLNQAFRKDTQDTNFCFIGSVKSNIGHLEAAAGIAGITKVILQMNHQRIVPSLHAKELNPNINFTQSPFVVAQELMEWKRPLVAMNGENMDFPRIAGISSFGAGGSNAHIVIEEYISSESHRSPINVSDYNSTIIILSAKNEDRLGEQVNRLLTAIEEKQFLNTDLPDMAYTLQVGREAMEERLAVVVGSIEGLREKLKSYLEGRDGIEDLYRGQVKRKKDVLNAFTADEDMQEVIKKWIQYKKYGKLADLWVKGLVFDWDMLYRDTKPCRISLPAYPFARELYWLPEINTTARSTTTGSSNSVLLHPLLHHNKSNFFEQRFSSTFTGQEFFLTDHVVNGQRVLPAAAYLEMARTAVYQAAALTEESQTVIRLKNIVWSRPIVVADQAVQVHIRLCPDDNNEISYEIYSESEADKAAGPVVYSQGSAVIIQTSKVENLNITELLVECGGNSLISSQFYDIFRMMGIDYGPAHQGIEKIYIGEGRVLAKLSLPPSVSDNWDQFVLHPSLMDAAFQASLGLLFNSGNVKPRLAFALQEIEILGKCSPNTWAFIRYSNDNSAGDKVQKLDIDVCNEHGEIYARMRGFSTRVLQDEIQTSKPLIGSFMLTPVWDEVPVEKCQPFPSLTDQIVMVGGDPDNRSMIQQHYPNARVLNIQSGDCIDKIVQKLESHGSIDHILYVAPYHSIKSVKEDALIEEQNYGVLQVFRMIKALLRLGYGTRPLGWSLITIQAQPVHKNDMVNPTHSSLHGFIGSLAKEYPNWRIRLIDMEAGCIWPVTDMSTLPIDIQGNPLAYRSKKWYRQQLIPVHFSQSDRTLYKPGGVYVVIGGAGGIGEVWSEYVIRTYQAQVIWIGRREKDAEIQAKVDRLGRMGPAPYYITADATDQKALQQAYNKIKEQYLQIDGLIHSAVGVLDQSIAKMDEERFRVGLSVKVDVSVRMNQVFGNEPLDFIMFFSSIASFLKDHGKASYHAGCTFKDVFAHQLAHEQSCAVKVINWGYWGDKIGVGSIVPQVVKNRLALSGIGSIEPPEAMEALELLLAGPMDQIALIKTTKSLNMDGLNQEELITIHPPNFPYLNIMNQIVNTENSEETLEGNGGNLRKPPFVQDIDEHLSKLLWIQLQSMGLFADQNQVISDLKIKAGMLDLYDKWLEESLAVLSRNNYVRYEGVSIRVIDSSLVDTDSVWKEWESRKVTWMKDPNLKARVVLVEAMLRNLPGILTGKLPSTDIMFPNSSMELVEGIYKNNPIADYFNEVAADSLVAYVQERIKQDPLSQIRILEIGAGTGGTSATVFRKLRPYQQHILEYCYTDMSKAFLMHAEREYGPETPYLTYKIFNVEKPIAVQGISVGGYDIVIATNVLHATKNIRHTLRNTKATLKNNGLIILNEMSSNSLFTHLTFGLLEGWWLYEDNELRISGCPGLYPESWRAVLESEGFQSILFPIREAHDLGQQVIVAASDGVIRQKQQGKTGAAFVQQRAENNINLLQINNTTSPKFKEKTVQSGIDVADHMVGDYIREIIIEKLSESLRVDIKIIDVDGAFADYGLDSITGVQLVQVINKTLMIELETTNLFDYSSVNQLTTYILSKYKHIIAKTLEGNVKCSGVDDSVIVNKEKDPVFSKPFFRKRGFPEVDIRNKEISTSPRDSIAIIGMSGRFAKSQNVTEFWEHLSKGVDLVEEVSRWDFSQYYTREKTNYCNYGSFLDNIDQFDPFFFNISGLEATYMDPQQRIFLEESWRALEDAGYAGVGVQGCRCGVYVGCNVGDYQQLLGDNPPPQAYWGNAASVIPARIAYYLNLQGPAVAVDTACSSSLVAIHLACQGLWAKETELALAGGVFIQSTSAFYLAANRMGIVSPTGRCYTFDERADGFVPGEGVGVVVLKPLREAIADGDHIYGVIRGSGINQDGTTNGITAPSANSQERLERYVYDTFNINPEQIQMVEAHGTGTKLGDPIEYEALTRSFRAYTDKIEYCAIGSIKTNIGHATTAAGVAGLIKILLSLQHKQIPPSLHYRSGNSNIRFGGSPFYVNKILKDWAVEPNSKRNAALSSFGLSGTNAHMVIEEGPGVERWHSGRPGYLVVLSARTSDQLRQQVEQLIQYCQRNTEIECGNMSYTLLLGRKHFNHRMACVARSSDELVALLKKWLKKGKVSQIYVSEVHENDRREQPSIKRYGNQCIQKCKNVTNASEYLELLSTIADLYVQGYLLEFEQLFAHEQYSRISLPTYPFAKESYWISESKQQIDKVSLYTERKMEFDDKSCGQLIDEVLDGTMSIGDAAQKIKDTNLYNMGTPNNRRII